MKISKELLSEVLGVNGISSIIYDIDFPNIIEYNQYATLARGMRSTEINIYELAHEIEDWIESKDINVIRIKENKMYEFYINAYIDVETNELFFENSITSETKINGIIAVGEFILKENK